jgi:ATP-dependent Clp protease ATP-binding subunit ClpC
MRFTEKARMAVFAAQEVADRYGESEIGPEHLLLGLLEDSGGVAAAILQRAGVSREALRADLERRLPLKEAVSGERKRLTAAGKQVIDRAYVEARRLNSNSIGTEHLFLGIAAEEQSLAARLLREYGARLEPVREIMAAMQEGGERTTGPAARRADNTDARCRGPRSMC